MNYPDDWPCKKCERPFKLHVKIGAAREEGMNREIAAHVNWCFSKDAIEYAIKHSDTIFTPIDNLSLIEILAKQKGITERNNKNNTLENDNPKDKIK